MDNHKMAGDKLLDFETFYLEYLGIHKDHKITLTPITKVSQYRKLLLNGRYIYPIIFSDFKAGQICSCIDEYETLCSKHYDGTVKSIKGIYTSIVDQSKEKTYTLRKFKRYAVADHQSKISTKAIPLTYEIIDNTYFAILQDKESYKKKKQFILDEQRQFVIIDQHQIAATAFISDIYNKGCNIVVYTDPQYRNRGYGKEVVKACIIWCYEHGFIPIYLVDETNIPSIRLAKGVGFEQQCTEWTISYTI